jgi:hypothetical protein
MINFGAGKLIAVPTNLSDGTVIANPTPVILGTMQDIALDISVDLKTLYGSKRYPIAVGQGKGKVGIKAKYADISGGILGSLFFGKASTAGIKAAVFDFSATIPTTPFQATIAPPSSGTYVSDLGVVFSATGVQLTRVASAPITGQYSVNVATGVYTFAAADTGLGVKISYEYSAAAGGNYWNISNDVMGYTPSFTILLQNSYDNKTMVVKLNRCVSGKLSVPLKNDDFAINDFEAEAFADATDSIGYICLI